MDKKKRSETPYWQDIEDKKLESTDLSEEFSEGTYTIGMNSKSRRDFLKIMGFSLSVLPMASSCKKIVAQKAIPYLHKNDQITPGVANWYATTSGLCPTHCSLLVKTREGRPIKVEGNTLSPLSKGGTCPGCQASVLSLYDSSRFKSPKKGGSYSSFSIIDEEIVGKLKSSKDGGTRTALIAGAVYGPSQLRAIEEFRKTYPNTDVIIYNPMGDSAQLAANIGTYDTPDVFQYDLTKAELILGISSDFLASGIHPVALTKQYAARRDLFATKDIVRHVQVESLMTLTGSNADHRHTISRDEESAFINNLLFSLQESSQRALVPVQKSFFANEELLNHLATELLNARGKSVVLSDSTIVADRIKINAINELLGNMGVTINFSGREFQRYENDADFIRFVESAQSGSYSAVIFYDVNPYYDFYDQKPFQAAMKAIPLKISLAGAPDETSEHCDYVVPDRHYLEKWDDFELARGVFSFSQPLIESLFQNRAAQDTLLVWSGSSQDYLSLMKERWSSEWNKAIHDGILIRETSAKSTPAFKLISHISMNLIQGPAKLRLVTYQKIGLQKGKLANNPWLQEMPDPITKATWDNYLMISAQLAKHKSIKTGDVVTIKAAGRELAVPALVQPGVHPEVMALATGYGRTVSGRAGKGVGVNAWPFVTFENETFQSGLPIDSITRTSEHYDLALTQTHHSMEGRDIVRETSLGEYRIDPKAGNPDGVRLVSMWKEHKKDGQQWTMMIDLNKCTGCSGCIISCNAENNVPVVGKEEVHNRREMHWLRLDRYYKGSEENPEVVHQPMLCAHCENAPCETVCPVLATVHSSDGLNQQVYNRCVGTRYCANNCPTKVRRFNWFDYAHDDKLENMVLNPDIAVRTRGVMEKCSMCVQRIQEGKLQAKKEGRPLRDGEVKLACQQSCPADAIVFGDMNDPGSEISQKLKDPRYYRVLEELGISPRVGYLTKVRNKDV